VVSVQNMKKTYFHKSEHDVQCIFNQKTNQDIYNLNEMYYNQETNKEQNEKSSLCLL
jgi:phosphotransferase system IIB component